MLYDGTAPEQKTENAKNALGIAQGVFQSLRQHDVLPPPFNKGGSIGFHNYIWRGSDHFIDSLKSA